MASASAKYTGPSANLQWQKSMAWVRTNTSDDSIFVHWWDYGYWVEGLGNRRAVADGGHFQGIEGIHRIGRYVLTTTKPETALSYFKSMNTDYLLIDPTDLGKYPAYSRIGSDENWDRYGMFPVGVVDQSQVYESKNSTSRLYRLNGVVDDDINYKINGVDVFLPGPTYDEEGNPAYKAFIGGILLTTQGTQVSAPEGIFLYNGQQYKIPFRYLYINGEIRDFKTGVNATAMLIPAIENTGNGALINQVGGIIFMTPKTSQSLFAQLYLMDDPFGKYPTIKLSHVEDDPVVNSIKTSGNIFGSDFLYYNGFRGPIKIWDTREIPDDIVFRSEFYSPNNGDFAGLDDLEFRR
ncbi:MAG: hypothetical protein Q8N88_01315 [Nanoarchaeota archaeon]|nr:hypothetical protein [Nanoarchaeota archaeon]